MRARFKGCAVSGSEIPKCAGRGAADCSQGGRSGGERTVRAGGCQEGIDRLRTGAAGMDLPTFGCQGNLGKFGAVGLMFSFENKEFAIIKKGVVLRIRIFSAGRKNRSAGAFKGYGDPRN